MTRGSCGLLFSSVYLFYFRPTVVVGKYFFIVISFFSHHRGSYLTETNTMAPAGTGDDEPLRNTVHGVEGIYHEGTAQQVTLTQGTMYLLLLAQGERTLTALDFQ